MERLWRRRGTIRDEQDAANLGQWWLRLLAFTARPGFVVGDTSSSRINGEYVRQSTFATWAHQIEPYPRNNRLAVTKGRT